MTATWSASREGAIPAAKLGNRGGFRQLQHQVQIATVRGQRVHRRLPGSPGGQELVYIRPDCSVMHKDHYALFISV